MIPRPGAESAPSSFYTVQRTVAKCVTGGTKPRARRVIRASSLSDLAGGFGSRLF